jgi:hypothetical protein
MEQTIEQRLATVEQTLASLASTVSQLAPVKKDWRRAAGKLRDTAFNREADRLGREYRDQQNALP